jgi:phosphomannomutase
MDFNNFSLDDFSISIEDLNKDMFRDYDYRNTGPSLKPEIVFILGLVWGEMAISKAKNANIKNNKVLIAKDARKIEPELENALISALRYLGLDIIYIAKDTPNCVTSYSWAVQEFKPLMSIFITASHVSQPEQIIVRGFKVAMLDKLNGYIESLTIKEIKHVSLKKVEELVFNPKLISSKESKEKGNFFEYNIDENVIKFNSLIGLTTYSNNSLYEFSNDLKKTNNVKNVLENYELNYDHLKNPFNGLKIVVEGFNTPSGIIASETFKKLGAEVFTLNNEIKEISGLHNADPSIDSNREELQKEIIKYNADLGLAFDLDGDRGAIEVPIRRLENNILKTEFRLLSPDNLIIFLLPDLINKWGYLESNKNIGVIKDVLSTFGINQICDKLNIKLFQTDSGYVFLKEVKAKEEENNFIFPIYGERSGHTWMEISGEIENPLAVAICFCSKILHEKEKIINNLNDNELLLFNLNLAYNVYNENTIHFSQSPRFQPLFHKGLLKTLSKENKLAWVFEDNSLKNPPSTIIALGKDYSIKKLKDEFKVGKVYTINEVNISVKEFNSYKDSLEMGDLYRFADIVFEKNNHFFGRFVFRASSNDPTFVCSYEVPILENESKNEINQKREIVSGLVLDFLRKNELALITKEDLISNFNHLHLDDINKKYQKSNLEFVERDYNNFKRLF